MEKNFTIMIPTRKRPVLLANLIESIVNTTENKNSVEIIVMYDGDDISTIGVVENLIGRFGNKISLKFISRVRSYSINNDYYNEMALKHATGKYLIAVNDDTIFRNYAWDTMASKKIDDYLIKYTDGIFYGITDDREVERKRNQHFWFSCFPLISMKAVKFFGFFFDPKIHKDGADWDIYGLYKEIDRTLDLKLEIVIEHISVRSGRRSKDALDDDKFDSGISSPTAGYNTHKYSALFKDYIYNVRNSNATN